jgi:hypothetical protein
MFATRICRLGAAALLLSTASLQAHTATKRHHKSHGSGHETADSIHLDLPRQILPWGVASLSAEVEGTLKPKDSFKECSNCPEMVVVPAGEFLMGTPTAKLIAMWARILSIRSQSGGRLRWAASRSRSTSEMLAWPIAAARASVAKMMASVADGCRPRD